MPESTLKRCRKVSTEPPGDNEGGCLRMYTSAELLMDQSKTGYGIMMAVTTVSFPPELEALQQSKGLRLSCFAAEF